MSDTKTILIRNGRVVTCVGLQPSPEVFKADLLLKNGIISEIFQGGFKGIIDGLLVIDATDKLICPGFIDTHRHVWEGAYKWMGDWALLEYVAKCLFVLQPLITAEDAYASQMLGNLEALNAGICTVVDHSHLTTKPEVFDAMLDATVKSGIRSVFCYGRWDEWPAGEKRKDWQIQQIRHIASRGTGSSRVTLGLAVDGLGDDYYEELRTDILPLAREIGINVISTHYVSTSTSIGPDAIGQLARRGLLDQSFLFVHANSLTSADCDLLRTADASISSTPEIELNMGHGPPVANTALKAGVRVGLGIDCSSVVGGDMFSVMRSCLTHQRGVDNDRLAARNLLARELPFRTKDVFRLATIGGARAIHQESMIGSIEVGKKADLLLIETLSPSMLGTARDPVQGIVLHCTPADVVMVIVDGEIVVDKSKPSSEGVFTRVRWNDEVRRVQESLKDLEAKVSNFPATEDKVYADMQQSMGLGGKLS